MGKQWKQWQTFILGGSKITVDDDCNHEIKRHLLLGRKVMTNIDSILKHRDITLPTRVHLIKARVFPAVMYECESWTTKKAECQKIDAFEPWCWRRLLRVPWTARSSSQSILKEISPEYSLEGLMLKLKLEHFGHLLWRTDSLEKTLMLGKIEGRRRRGQQRMRWLDASPTQWTWVWVNSGSWWWTGRPGVLQCMGSQRVRHNWATEPNWTELLVKMWGIESPNKHWWYEYNMAETIRRQLTVPISYKRKWFFMENLYICRNECIRMFSISFS